MAVLEKSLVDGFQDDGVVLLKGVFNDWIELLRAGVDVDMNEPGPWGRENSVASTTIMLIQSSNRCPI